MFHHQSDKEEYTRKNQQKIHSSPKAVPAKL